MLKATEEKSRIRLRNPVVRIQIRIKTSRIQNTATQLITTANRPPPPPPGVI
jgi:hypothetical protein